MGQTFETEAERIAFRALRKAGIAPEKAAEMARDQSEPGDDPAPPAPDPSPRSDRGGSSPAADALPGAKEFGAALDGIGSRLDRVEAVIREMGWDL